MNAGIKNHCFLLRLKNAMNRNIPVMRIYHIIKVINPSIMAYSRNIPIRISPVTVRAPAAALISRTFGLNRRWTITAKGVR